MLDMSICRFRGVRSVLLLLLFLMKILLAKNVDPDQISHYVVSATLCGIWFVSALFALGPMTLLSHYVTSGLCLHCLSFMGFQVRIC